MNKRTVLTYLLSAGILIIFGVIFFQTKQMRYPTALTSEMSLYYLEQLAQTGATNAVSAILLDFRAYDTLGEILVLFATISGVMLIARRAQ